MAADCQKLLGCLNRKGGSSVYLWRAFAAEAFGTATLVGVGCASSDKLGPAAFPLTVALVVQIWDAASGAHVNPAVTLAALLARRITSVAAVGYVLAQLAGAVAGAALLEYGKAASCVTRLRDGLEPWRGVVVETALTTALVLANRASWDSCNRRLLDSWPLRIGAVVAVLSAAGDALTGASMNPARSFGPALLSGAWSNHWVYWLGPLLGSVLGSLSYSVVWQSPADAHPRDLDAPPRDRKGQPLTSVTSDNAS